MPHTKQRKQENVCAYLGNPTILYNTSQKFLVFRFILFFLHLCCMLQRITDAMYVCGLAMEQENHRDYTVELQNQCPPTLTIVGDDSKKLINGPPFLIRGTTWAKFGWGVPQRSFTLTLWTQFSQFPFPGLFQIAINKLYCEYDKRSDECSAVKEYK